MYTLHACPMLYAEGAGVCAPFCEQRPPPSRELGAILQYLSRDTQKHPTQLARRLPEEEIKKNTRKLFLRNFVHLSLTCTIATLYFVLVRFSGLFMPFSLQYSIDTDRLGHQPLQAFSTGLPGKPPPGGGAGLLAFWVWKKTDAAPRIRIEHRVSGLGLTCILYA